MSPSPSGGVRIGQWTLDVRDIVLMAQFWAAALGYRIDADAEVERLLALGARHADVGQTGEEGFVVLTDPEGNAFCVLRGRRPDE